MKSDSLYLEHILESIGLIEKYLEGMSKEQFLSSSQTCDAVVRRIEIIGEASKKVSPGTRRKHPSIPWGDMAGMRDILIHKYFGVDLEIVWKTCTHALPDLKRQIKDLLFIMG